jgi:hypothetical protein
LIGEQIRSVDEMKRSTSEPGRRPKLTLQRESIGWLRPPQLARVVGGDVQNRAEEPGFSGGNTPCTT